mmetsp:Transcript_11907/g.36692  ORF Transcript_11907/g.36692 Transcript_11907/m.36692 type:complete len:184 (+) Transcript_11907:940-1491(+)
MPITASDQAFLQLLAQRKVMTESEAQESMDAVGQQLGSFGEDGGLRATIVALNKKLALQDLQIRGYYAGTSDAPVIYMALVNLASDDIAKAQGDTLSENEVETLKRLLAVLGGADDDTVEYEALRKERGKLGPGAFDAFCADLVEKRWLNRDHDNITYGPRSYLELSDVLRTHGADVPQMVNY